jgi:hypothetical protein
MPELLLRLMPIEPVVDDVRAGLDPLVLPDSDFVPLSDAGEDVAAAANSAMMQPGRGQHGDVARREEGINKRLFAVRYKRVRCALSRGCKR